MQKVISAVVALFVLLGSLPAFAQGSPPSEASRKAELMAAWQAASGAGTPGPTEVTLIDQAALKLTAGQFFVPKAEGARVLRALGNLVNDASLVGLVVGIGPNDGWIVVISYIKEGYIKDDDAKNDKRDCLAPGCGAIPFNKVVDGFVPRPDLLAPAQYATLYRRGLGRLRSALDLPAVEAV